jgi:predicted amidohydrolase YtcJ
MKSSSIALCFSFLAAALLATGCAMDAADTAFRSGKVYTMDPDSPWAEAIVIKDGRVIHVGEDYKLDQLVGPQTRVIDLQGRLVLPGFCEEHLQHLEDQIEDRDVDLEEILGGYTFVREFESREHDECDPIRVGSFADLIVLDRDLFEIPPGEIAGTRVDLALVAGNVVYERE